MPVFTLPFGALEANCHIVHNGTDAVVFDPSDDTAAVLDFLAKKNLTLRAIALTHLHVDHCLGCAELSKATGLIPVIGLEDWLQRGVLLGKGMCFGMDVKPFQAEPLTEGEVAWGSLNCKVIHTPGHSPGSLCYYFEDLGVLITGDLLFFRSVGRSDLPFGDGEALVSSLREKIYTLPGATLVYPGHGPETSVSFESIHNHFCRA